MIFVLSDKFTQWYRRFPARINVRWSIDVSNQIKANSCVGRQNEVIKWFRNEPTRSPDSQFVARWVKESYAGNIRVRQQDARFAIRERDAKSVALIISRHMFKCEFKAQLILQPSRFVEPDNVWVHRARTNIYPLHTRPNECSVCNPLLCCVVHC